MSQGQGDQHVLQRKKKIPQPCLYRGWGGQGHYFAPAGSITNGGKEVKLQGSPYVPWKSPTCLIRERKLQPVLDVNISGKPGGRQTRAARSLCPATTKLCFPDSQGEKPRRFHRVLTANPPSPTTQQLVPRPGPLSTASFPSIVHIVWGLSSFCFSHPFIP